MIGPFGKLPFRPTNRKRSGNCTTTMKRQDEIFLTILSSARSLPFPSQRNRPFPNSPAVNCPDFAATVTAFSRHLPMQDKTACSACEHHLQDPTHLLLDCPASESLRRAIFGTTVLLPFLTSGTDLGVWPDCWVSVEFLRAPIPWKGYGGTTTPSPRASKVN